MSGPTPRHLRKFVTRRLRLRNYLQNPGDGRGQPQIPAKLLLWALLVGQILRQSSFHAVEALAHSRARRNLSFSASFSDAWVPGVEAAFAAVDEASPGKNSGRKEWIEGRGEFTGSACCGWRRISTGRCV
jgi:hypothetical protein